MGQKNIARFLDGFHSNNSFMLYHKVSSLYKNVCFSLCLLNTYIQGRCTFRKHTCLQHAHNKGKCKKAPTFLELKKHEYIPSTYACFKICTKSVYY